MAFTKEDAEDAEKDEILFAHLCESRSICREFLFCDLCVLCGKKHAVD